MAGAIPSRTPVALVIQRRIRDEGSAAFAHWEARVTARLQAWPGFVSQENVPPSPPVTVDWTIVQHFTDADAARAWLQSADRAALIDEIQHQLVGPEEVHLLPETKRRPERASSVLITYDVPPAAETEFLKWQRRIQAAQTRFPGFLRHKIERPIPGVHDDWLIVLSFDSEANLSAWLNSPERLSLIKQGRGFGAKFKVHHTNYGFDFWFPGGAEPPTDRHGTFKSNLLILTVLYPVIFLWHYLIDLPVMNAHDVPLWLSLFIGSIATTQLLGWLIGPAIFRVFAWWTPPATGWRRQLLGYAVLAALCGLSMVFYAFLLRHPL